MAPSNQPCRGEVWLVNLNPTLGHEQSGIRPGLIVSTNTFNHGPAELVITLPITSKGKGIPFHVEVKAPEGGLTSRSFIKCEEIRSLSTERLMRKLGAVSDATLEKVDDRIKIILELHP
ncbi:MAG: type II toxin-antitoxin system PemK/MazF family toxin [Vicinamibacterales bacterium]